eukprot:gnl/Chilomastix_cuspidata/4082.p1 GENE.gnl/Chilomastix_cuspidata/4082~~gnl/Chilomastix_cuspidata/4082.p1  ORF type:complete len:158 (+),score=25.19 gnl/Chilomastix_cuspidata/4082:45-518(+)
MGGKHSKLKNKLEKQAEDENPEFQDSFVTTVVRKNFKRGMRIGILKVDPGKTIRLILTSENLYMFSSSLSFGFAVIPLNFPNFFSTLNLTHTSSGLTFSFELSQFMLDGSRGNITFTYASPNAHLFVEALNRAVQRAAPGTRAPPRLLAAHMAPKGE